MKVRGISVTMKLILGIIVFLIVSDTLLGITIYNKSKNLLVSQIKENAKNTSACVAASIDGSELSLVGNDESYVGTDEYNSILNSLAVFRDNSGVEYVYTIRKNEEGVNVFVVDSDPDEPGLPGEDFGDDSDEVDRAYKGESVVNSYEYVPNDNLNILKFEEMCEEWLNFIVNCRNGIEHNYDIVEGPMADDQIWNFIEGFLEGNISRDAFWELVKYLKMSKNIYFMRSKLIE